MTRLFKGLSPRVQNICDDDHHGGMKLSFFSTKKRKHYLFPFMCLDSADWPDENRQLIRPVSQRITAGQVTDRER